MGQYEEARSDLDALLADDPSYEPALLNRAMLAQGQGDYVEALADFDAYLALPVADQEYRRLASRTAELLRELVLEMTSEEE
jgi:tetratricopeptide (TPR) repeat protein